jgi:hypothetical protein
MYLQNYDSCRAAILHQAGPYFCSTLGETMVKEAAVVVEIQALQKLEKWRPKLGRQMPKRAKILSHSPDFKSVWPSGRLHNTPKCTCKKIPSFCNSLFHNFWTFEQPCLFFRKKKRKMAHIGHHKSYTSCH